MSEPYGGRGGRASVRALQQALATQLGTRLPESGRAPAFLEVAPPPTAPRCVAATLLDASTFVARRPGGPSEVGFRAFLDGVQHSVVAWLADDVVPVVHATTAAVVRERHDRALRTWNDACIVERCACLPRRLVSDAVAAAVAAAGLELVDTLPDGDGAPRHPHELTALAREAVQRRREAAEAALLARWCAASPEPLYVDGGIRASAATVRHAQAVGVVKSHNTVYVAPALLPVLARMAEGERTSAVRIVTRPGVAVASWYLRLRDGAGHDPLDGIVRVEVAEPAYTAEYADRVSHWVLAEREPLALPDPRWRVMAYGIRDCEAYLRAVVG